MSIKKVELNDELLDVVSGGQIQNTWDNDAQAGTLWIVSKSTPVVYKFTNYGVIDAITRLQNEGYSDQEVIEYLRDVKKVITEA